MRYTKTSLLVFGVGLVIGFFVDALDVTALERPTGALIVGGILAFPAAVAVDVWRALVGARPAKTGPPRGRKPARKPGRKTGTARRRPPRRR